MAKDNNNQPSVFISYSHKDEVWKDRLVTHLGVLKHLDLLTIWTDRHIDGGDDWFPEIENAINGASIAILMVTADFLDSDFIRKQEIPRLFKRRQTDGLCIYPVIVKPCAWKSIPHLSSINARPRDGAPLSGGDQYQIDTDLSEITQEIVSILNQPPEHDESVQFLQDSAPSLTPPLPEDPARISLNKLPATSPDLFGRDDYLDMLDAAWNGDKTNILTLVAFGGVGKTALVNHWLTHHMAPNYYSGADKVFTWSFYSQGTTEDRQASSEQFTAAALRFFGDHAMADSKASAFDKGVTLAQLIARDKNLLILDGLEPLQDPNNNNRIKDPAIASLLTTLAAYNKGLCIASTRLPIPDIKHYNNTTVNEFKLTELPIKAAIHLLKEQGAKGPDEELEQAANDYACHALALMLLGSYIKTAHTGDIRKRDRIQHLTDEAHQGEHAKHVMSLYERWFKGKAELQILRLLGLFDRPAELAAVDAIRTGDSIKGLTSNLRTLSDYQWQAALEHLREVNLLLPLEEDNPDVLDCHPLIREYFGDKLKQTRPSSWKRAHSRLYDYFCDLPEKDQPNTIEEMAPLYRAVYHGCAANLHQQALHDIYQKRIQRGLVHFNWHELGAYSADLAAVTCFFKSPWHEPSPNLTDPLKGFILNEAAFDLRALGRLAEAAPPFKACLDIAVDQEDWLNGAQAASSLSQLYLTLGRISDAIIYGKQSIVLADKSNDAFQKVICRTTFADTLTQADKTDEAIKLFTEAQQLRKDRLPDVPFLYSFGGYRYCGLLLEHGEFDQVINLANQILLQTREHKLGLLSIALGNLSLGHAHLQKTLTENTGDFNKAAEHLDVAVNSLRKAGIQDFLPFGLLTRAELNRVTNDLPAARHDLDETYTLSARIGAKLHQADCCLEYTRLYLAEDDKGNTRKYFEEAEAIITETGYHRRDKDLVDLRPKLT